jgi:hypothetical protein
MIRRPSKTSILDLTGPAGIHQGHALGLVGLAVDAIEHRVLDAAEQRRVAVQAQHLAPRRHRVEHAVLDRVDREADVEVRGAEHYFEPHRILSCAAMPILGPDGAVLGISTARRGGAPPGRRDRRNCRCPACRG